MVLAKPWYQDRHAVDALISSKLFGNYSFACFLPVSVTSGVVDQFYVKLFFCLELVLGMIRVGATFRL